MLLPENLQNFLDVANTQPVIYIPEITRNIFEEITHTFALPKLDVPFIVTRSLQLTAHNIDVRIYHPDPEKKLPVILYCHGGGHMCGTLESYDALCRRLAVTSNCVVLLVAYRWAPEFPYPAGLLDCIAAFEHRADLLKGIQAHTDYVFVTGDSAGGNLAISVSSAMKKKGDNAIKGLVLMYPSVDFSMNHESFQRNGEGFLLTRTRVKWYFDNYFVPESDRVAASPLCFTQLNLLPPMYLAVAEYDPLLDEGILFAKTIQSLGGFVSLEEFGGMVHMFAQLETLVPDEVLRLHQSIKNFISAVQANKF